MNVHNNYELKSRNLQLDKMNSNSSIFNNQLKVKSLRENIPIRKSSNLMDTFSDYIYSNTPLKAAMKKAIEIVNKNSKEMSLFKSKNLNYSCHNVGNVIQRDSFESIF